MTVKDIWNVFHIRQTNDNFYSGYCIWVSNGQNENGSLKGIDLFSFLTKKEIDVKTEDVSNLSIAQLSLSVIGNCPYLNIFVKEEDILSKGKEVNLKEELENE